MLIKEGNKYTNPKAYKPVIGERMVEITLTVYLDVVPGWGDNAEDHVYAVMRNNPYIQHAEVREVTAKGDK